MAVAIGQSIYIEPVTGEDISRLKLHLPTLKIVSERGLGDAGCVPACLEPAALQLDAKIHWIALSSIFKTSQNRGFTFHHPNLPTALIESYERFCFEYFWHLFYGQPENARFDVNGFRAFQQINELVAAESLNIAAESYPTLYWLHDYQTALLAPLISMEAGCISCHFWHVAWPEPNIIASSPIGRELIEALLANRLIGFHNHQSAINFLNSVMQLIKDATVDLSKMEIKRSDANTQVVVMPAGIDFAHWTRLAKASQANASVIPKKYKLANQLVLNVDRLDYSKGVLEKLEGLESFLENNSEYLRRFHYVQIAQAPRSDLPYFQEYANLVRAKVEAINERFLTEGWKPILWLEEQLEQEQIAAWYQAADVLLVSPTTAGLNLIAKEYIACRQDEQGVLVLSKTAGCVEELKVGSLLIDHQNADDIALAIKTALTMNYEEKRRRMLAMRHVVNFHQLHDWALGFLRQAVTT